MEEPTNTNTQRGSVALHWLVRATGARVATPQGTELRKGQKWKELDNRFQRVVEVTGWDEQREKVQLNGRTWAALKRFNGKSQGYEPLSP